MQLLNVTLSVIGSIIAVLLAFWPGIVLFTTALLWLRTAVDPLTWFIRLLIVIRAAIALAFVVFYESCIAWWERMPKAIEDSRREVQG